MFLSPCPALTLSIPSAIPSSAVLERIADALERLAPPPPPRPDLNSADAFVWTGSGSLVPVPRVNKVDISLLQGIDRVRDLLLANTRRFAAGLPANNALLGARGAWANPPS